MPRQLVCLIGCCLPAGSPTDVATATSVLLGTLHLDLYIAVSAALVSFCTSVLEYQRLEASVVIHNNCIKDLTRLAGWWSSLTFVERRMPQHKDRLVRITEDSAMAEATAFYQNAPTAMSEEGSSKG